MPNNLLSERYTAQEIIKCAEKLPEFHLSLIEGGYISNDRAVVLYFGRDPYIGMLLEYEADVPQETLASWTKKVEAALRKSGPDLLEDEKVMARVYEEHPREESYPNTYLDGLHNCRDGNPEMIYCDGDTDIMRCRKCGHEWTEPCSFDDDYN